MKFAVLGASGMGQFHIREIIKLKNELTCILGSTEESARITAQNLNRLYGIIVNYYWDIDELLEKEEIEAVSICTPLDTHYEFTKKCLNKGLHVLCEKPFVETEDKAEELIKIAKTKNLMLGVNTQWVSFLRYLNQPKDISSFKLYSEPGSHGIDFVKDHLPHALSILIKLIPNGKISNLNFPVNEQKRLVIEFNFSNKKDTCAVNFTFSYKKERPRKIEFFINNEQYKRELDKDYNQYLVIGNNSRKIEDPLLTSIKSFINSIQGKENSLNSFGEILENVKNYEIITKILIKDNVT